LDEVVAIFSEMTEGSALASITDEEVSEDTLFLAMAGLLSATSRTTTDFNLGNPQTILTKTKEGTLLIRGISPTLLIILLYRGEIDMGRIVTQDIALIDRVKADILKQIETEKI